MSGIFDRIMKLFDICSYLSGLKPNKSKCEVARTDALKGVKFSLSGVKCNDLQLNTIKILDINFSYNDKIGNNEQFLNRKQRTISKAHH